jgi:hypothetical protein
MYLCTNKYNVLFSPTIYSLTTQQAQHNNSLSSIYIAGKVAVLCSSIEYTMRLLNTVVRQHAVHLRETFGGHCATYYEQEILQRGRLERGRRKTSRWNVYVRRELELRNAGMCFSTSHPGAI